ncbi:hypothetical protein [Streptomyces coeruleorubidus]|uniref:hypothetical protein n=1 Tax=Streptomyces coeruleorubidus TaxID=116188 RepID=UPI0036D1A761
MLRDERADLGARRPAAVAQGKDRADLGEGEPGGLGIADEGEPGDSVGREVAVGRFLRIISLTR